MFQEKVLKAGPQDNEDALEQAKDKKIADTIREQALSKHMSDREKQVPPVIAPAPPKAPEPMT